MYSSAQSFNPARGRADSPPPSNFRTVRVGRRKTEKTAFETLNKVDLYYLDQNKKKTEIAIVCLFVGATATIILRP